MPDALPLELLVQDENRDGIRGCRPPNFMNTATNARTSLRSRMRQRRRRLDPALRRRYAQQLASHLARSRLFQKSRKIAFYLPNDGEIDLRPLLELAWKRKKRCYLPVLGFRHGRSLWFLPCTPHIPLYRNRFGIEEPVHTRRTRLFNPRSLDIIFMPLVAFDRQGNRLGMGGGFYDRTLAYLQHRRHWHKPHLIGSAYQFQQVDALDNRVWDIPLEGVATENGLRIFSHD